MVRSYGVPILGVNTVIIIHTAPTEVCHSFERFRLCCTLVAVFTLT